jgi:hypothetical protein
LARLLVTGLRAVDFDARPIWLNGSPAFQLDVDGRVDTAVSVTIEDGRITRLYAMRNPSKLAHLSEVVTLTRA